VWRWEVGEGGDRRLRDEKAGEREMRSKKMGLGTGEETQKPKLRSSYTYLGALSDNFSPFVTG
jgi:hypothetical protein